MTNEEFITLIEAKLGAYHAKVDAQNTVTNAKLEAIDCHLKTLNGTVAKHEETINKRALVVQEFQDFKEDFKTVPTQIRHLEDNQLSQQSIKKWVVGAISITATVVSIVFTLIQHFAK